MIDLNGKLRLHEAFTHRVEQVGRERTPVLVIDNFLSDPGLLVDCASECAFAPAGAYYPGVRAPAPPIYAFAVRAFLGDLIRRTFALPSTDIEREKCDFSLVTTRPEQLSPLQRVPHIDNTGPAHFAALHYLCDARHGGTAFYRHRATGFEVINQDRYPAYRASMEAALASDMPPPAYIRGDTPMFERIAAFDAALNRVLVYRGWSLHCADIPADFAFDPHPRRGRLTANAFFCFR